MRWTFAIIGLALLAAFAWPAAAETPVNLLKLPSVKLEATSLGGGQTGSVPSLIDGNHATAATIEAGGAQTVDFVFGFAGETVAPEAVVVALSKQRGSVPPVRIEVLASMASAEFGFKSLRADPIRKSKPVQTFAFVPSAARWIMVRLTLPKGAKSVSLAEIEILGHPGQPETKYAFKESPARVIDILARLEKSSPVPLAISEDEKRAFQKAKAGRLSADDFAEVALLASGVHDPVKRKHYLDRIDALAQKARAATASAKDAKQRGDALLRWLHREVLKKGYRYTQSSLSVLLDKQTYNCVSSAVLHNIIALKLGIDARAIEVPDHVFSIVYEGASHWDVETTTALGFNPSRDQIKNFERLTGFRYIPETHRDQRREVTEAGLAALIYYNRGVELIGARRHHEALLAFVRAMNLDSEAASAAKNALATLGAWGYSLVQQGKYQQAIEILTIGVELMPNDLTMANAQRSVWFTWVYAEINAGHFPVAADALSRGFITMPDEPLLSGLTIMLVDGWTKKAMKSGLQEDWEGAASLYAGGVTQFPQDAMLRSNIAYFFQEWARSALDKGNPGALVSIARNARAKFPADPGAREAIVNIVANTVNDRVKTRKFEDAIAIVDQTQDILPPGTATQLFEFSYHNWADQHMKKKQWTEAAGIYERGLKQLPRSALFKQNRDHCLTQARIGDKTPVRRDRFPY